MPNTARLSEIYFAKRDVLLRYLTRLCGDEASAEDVLQDLYLRLMRGGIDGEIQEPLAFLFRMANNLWLNRRRALNSREAREDAWHGLNPQVEADADATPDAEAVLGARQELRAVLKDIDALPPKTRDIFRLHKLEGLSQTEVARRLDISISSVEKHLSGALKHLLALNRSRKLH
ncbi:RNA polymerase sigma factor [Asticcacaulis sp. AND118]|uniref:RNA polymerase sigma factor n=1 Tax=Asticcacaulis sp. AND118 TaxID=2840468 RepID=UPI001CFF8B85|nr:RNA polymerase sigma factor [Asticcacaulis sp. AND118]UDF04545.1 RNA polymerase sigma factor [Asticcacaulis sp. AND118]